MRAPIRGLSILVCASGIACAPAKVVIPSAEGLSDSHASVVRIEKGAGPAGLSSYITTIRDSNGTPVLTYNGFQEYKYVKLRPGSYEITVLADYPARKSAYPRIRLVLLPGKTYLVHAEDTGDGKAKAEYRVIDTADDHS